MRDWLLLPVFAGSVVPAVSAATALEQSGSGTAEQGVQLNNEGHALSTSGRHAEAAGLYRQALTMLMGVEARTPANRAATLNNYGVSLATLGALNEAQQAFEQAVQLREKFFDPLAAPTLLSHHDLGVVPGRMDQTQRASEQSRLAWRGRVQTRGADHPDTLASLQVLEGCARE